MWTVLPTHLVLLSNGHPNLLLNMGCLHILRGSYVEPSDLHFSQK